MKKVVIENQSEKIDWSKPQWVQHIEIKDMIVLTNGIHYDNCFSGTCLPCRTYNYGNYTGEWPKVIFKPLIGQIQFIISNED